MADTAAIADEIQRIHSEYYGQPPGAVRVYEAGDVLVVLIEETFTRAEQILIGRGEATGRARMALSLWPRAWKPRRRRGAILGG